MRTRKFVKKNDGALGLNRLYEKRLCEKRSVAIGVVSVSNQHPTRVLRCAEVEVEKVTIWESLVDGVCGQRLTTTRRSSHKNVPAT